MSNPTTNITSKQARNSKSENSSNPMLSKEQANALLEIAWKENPHLVDFSNWMSASHNGKGSRQAAICGLCAVWIFAADPESKHMNERSINPDFRKQIRNCTRLGCPLWKFRPFQGKAT